MAGISLVLFGCFGNAGLAQRTAFRWALVRRTALARVQPLRRLHLRILRELLLR
jgi:hypothetical protein